MIDTIDYSLIQLIKSVVPFMISHQWTMRFAQERVIFFQVLHTKCDKYIHYCALQFSQSIFLRVSSLSTD